MKKIHIILKHTVVGGLFVSLMCSCTNYYEKKAQEFISQSHLREKTVFIKTYNPPYGVLYIGDSGAYFHDLKNDSDELLIEQEGIVKWSSVKTDKRNISVMTLSDSYGKVSDLSYRNGKIHASTKLEGQVNQKEKKYVFTDYYGFRTSYDSVTGICTNQSFIENPYDIAIEYINHNYSLDFLLYRGYSKNDSGEYVKTSPEFSLSHSYSSEIRYGTPSLYLKINSEEAFQEVRKLLKDNGFVENNDPYVSYITFNKGIISFGYLNQRFDFYVDQEALDYLFLDPISVDKFAGMVSNEISFSRNYLGARIAVTGLLKGVRIRSDNVTYLVTLERNYKMVDFVCSPILEGYLMKDKDSKITICGTVSNVDYGDVYLENVTAY